MQTPYDLTNVNTIKNFLTTHHIAPKKYHGQHFLVNRSILNTIIESTHIAKNDTVLEIGPGLGVLTLELARRTKKVVTIEVDKQLTQILANMLCREKIKNVEIINLDALNFSPKKLLPINYQLVSNLPYEITSPVLWKFLHEEKHKPTYIVLMLQKEVADRLAAKPGNMSLLSVLVQYYTHVTIVRTVKPGNFYPPPRVDSTIVNLVLKKQRTPLVHEKIFFEFVKRGFSSKRKMLKNNLTTQLKLKESSIAAMFSRANIKLNARAQELSVKEWITLYQIVYTINKGAKRAS